DGEDLIEAGKDGQQGVAVGGARGALIERNIGGADQFEDGGQRLGGVEIVGEGGIHCRLGGGGGLAQRALASGQRTAAEPIEEAAQAIEGGGGLVEAFEGEIELAAVGHGSQQVADGAGTVALLHQVA